MQGDRVLVNPPSILPLSETIKKKNCTLFSLNRFFCKKQFSLQSCAKCETITAKVWCLNKYNVPTAILVDLWKPFHHIVTYSKGHMPCKDECILCSISLNKNIYLLSKVCAIWRPFNHIIQPVCQTSWIPSINICLHTFLWNRQKRAERKRFYLPNRWFSLDLLGDSQVVQGNIWDAGS